MIRMDDESRLEQWRRGKETPGNTMLVGEIRGVQSTARYEEGKFYGFFDEGKRCTLSNE